MVLDDMDALFKNRKYPCRIKRWRTPNDVTIITPYRDPVELILPMNIQDVMPKLILAQKDNQEEVYTQDQSHDRYETWPQEGNA